MRFQYLFCPFLLHLFFPSFCVSFSMILYSCFGIQKHMNHLICHGSSFSRNFGATKRNQHKTLFICRLLFPCHSGQYRAAKICFTFLFLFLIIVGCIIYFSTCKSISSYLWLMYCYYCYRWNWCAHKLFSLFRRVAVASVSYGVYRIFKHACWN